MKREMGEPQFENIEPNKELEPKDRKISIIFMRHGQSNYEDFQNRLKGGEARDKTLLPDLNEAGVKNITEKAEQLAQAFDKEHDLVVIWTSPELRAIGTGQIIEEVLEKAGVTVIRNKEISSLAEAHADTVDKLKMSPQKFHSYFDLSGLTEEQLQEVSEAKAVMDDPNIPFGEAWRNYAGKEKFENIEGTDVPKKRFNRVVNSFFRLKKVMKPSDPSKNLKFICINHEDLPNHLLEYAFDKGLINHKGLGNGETVELAIESEDNVTANHQGEEKQLLFDREKREFV